MFIEFELRFEDRTNGSAIVRIDDIVDVTLDGPFAQVATSKHTYATTKLEYSRIIENLSNMKLMVP